MSSPLPTFFRQLLLNGDFELWSLGPDTLPDYWGIITEFPTGSGKETTIVKLGTASLKIIGNGKSFSEGVIIVNPDS
jgi:hypothetical protein